MAVPQRRDPEEERLHISNLGDLDAVEGVSRGGWRWWWAWPIVIALAVWWAGWGWGGTGGWWWGRTRGEVIQPAQGAQTAHTLANAGAQQPAASATLGTSQQPMSGPGVQILRAQDKQPFLGRQFAASDVPVKQKVNARAMWIGESNRTMLAVMTGARHDSAKGVSAGQIVDALGTVEKAPPEAKAKREWKLTGKEASALEKQGAYIQVSQLTIPPQ